MAYSTLGDNTNSTSLPPIQQILPSPLLSPAAKQTITVIGAGLRQGYNINFSPNDPTDPNLTHPTTQGYNGPLYAVSADGTSAKADVNLNGNAILWQVQIIAPYTNQQSPAFMVTSEGGVAGPLPVDPMAVAMAQWNAALQGQTMTLPSGQTIPVAFITDGPTTLPDGNVYVVFADPRVARPVVAWWHGDTWKPRSIAFPSANPGAVTRFNMAEQPQNIQGRNPWVLTQNADLIQLADPGTGSWYLEGLMNGPNAIGLTPPPSGWSGTYSLPSVVMASLQVGGNAPGVPLGPPAIPSPASGAGVPLPSMTLEPMPAVIAAPAGSMVSIDQGGNVVAPPVEVHALPVQSPSTAIQAVQPMNPLLVVGAIAAAVFLFGRSK